MPINRGKAVHPTSRPVQPARRATAVAIARARPGVDVASTFIVTVLLSLLLSVAAWMYAT